MIMIFAVFDMWLLTQ